MSQRDEALLIDLLTDLSEVLYNHDIEVSRMDVLLDDDLICIGMSRDDFLKVLRLAQLDSGVRSAVFEKCRYVTYESLRLVYLEEGFDRECEAMLRLEMDDLVFVLDMFRDAEVFMF